MNAPLELLFTIYSKGKRYAGNVLREKPCNDSLSDGRAINIAPLQLGEEVRWIHSARFDEALVHASNSTLMRVT